jgi:hypothetical protein
MRHVYPNHEIPYLWAHQTQDEARNSISRLLAHRAQVFMKPAPALVTKRCARDHSQARLGSGDFFRLNCAPVYHTGLMATFRR